jgi:predicted glutamine amidotransferase
MGRLFGIVAADITPFARWLLSAPQSLNGLSTVVPDGWGAAVFDHTTAEWTVERRPLGVAVPERFSSISPRLQGTVMVAHLGARRAGSADSAQPVRRGAWVFAHEGRLDDIAFVRGSISPARYRERMDASNAELLLAFFLTHLDSAKETEMDITIRDAVTELADRNVGAFSFLLSNGNRFYAYCGGPPLHIVRAIASSPVLLIASEPLTDEKWEPLEAQSLLRTTPASAHRDVVFLRGAAPAPALHSDRELPFTD